MQANRDKEEMNQEGNQPIINKNVVEDPHKSIQDSISEKIKYDPDTERLRIEQQSIIDSEKGRDID